jgi:hypothetical protein
MKCKWKWKWNCWFDAHQKPKIKCGDCTKSHRFSVVIENGFVSVGWRLRGEVWYKVGWLHCECETEGYSCSRPNSVFPTRVWEGISSRHDGLDDGCPTQRYASCLSSLIGKEQGIGYVNEYDGKSVYTMLLESDQHLHFALWPIKHDESWWEFCSSLLPTSIHSLPVDSTRCPSTQPLSMQFSHTNLHLFIPLISWTPCYAADHSVSGASTFVRDGSYCSSLHPWALEVHVFLSHYHIKCNPESYVDSCNDSSCYAMSATSCFDARV